MTLHFYKYHGAGNDFVLLDNRDGACNGLTTEQIHFLCTRHFGIGADGLMSLNEHPEADFEMKYYNADGREGSMCGNGGRCIVAFAARLGIVRDHYRFEAVDGIHEAVLGPGGKVDLKMKDVDHIERGYDFAILDTGSPHYVKYVDQLEARDVVKQGRAIRNSERFNAEGINVNFVEYGTDALNIRTYERGVEDETFACGTGITAAALVVAGNRNQTYRIPVKARGGELEVRYTKKDDQHYEDIWLSGPTRFVFEGTLEV